MTRVVTFGEVMLRLKSPGFERLFQSPRLEATFGGAEANVAVSLAQFGLPVSFVTAFPSNPLGESAVGEIRKFGVDTSFIKRVGDRLGIYFLESGSNQRASKVTYDRAGSSIAAARPGDFDWNAILDGASWFHISGVTPAISASAAALSLEAVKAARSKRITVSCDYNYRKNLWSYGKKAPEVMREIVSYANIGIANEEDCQKALGVEIDGSGTREAGSGKGEAGRGKGEGGRGKGNRGRANAGYRAVLGAGGKGFEGIPQSREAGNYAARESQRRSQRMVGDTAQSHEGAHQPQVRHHQHRRQGRRGRFVRGRIHLWPDYL